MRCICSLSRLSVPLLLLATGCQTIAPRPLDLSQTTSATRPVDIAPIAAFAAALDADTEAPAAFDIADGLTLREGQAVALWYNPDLRIARLKAESAENIAAIPGMLDDPEIGVDAGRKSVDSVEDSFLREAKSVSRSWIRAGSLSITIPISGRVRVERELRRTKHEAALRDAEAAEWRVLSEVREAWARWTAEKSRVQLLEEHLAILGAFAETADSLASVGELTPSSARLFFIERMRREADREQARAAEIASRLNVLQILGLLPDAPAELVPEMNVITALSPSGPEQHPEIARLRAEYEIAEDALRLELRKQYPDITLSPAYAKEEDESSITLGLGFPVPVWNANRSGIAAALAARDLARLEVETAYERLLADLARARVALDGAHAVRDRLAEGVVPAVDAQITEARALLSVGEIEISFLYDTLTQALETKLEYLDAVHAETHAAARLYFLTAFDAAPAAVLGEDDK